jgi:hypothetical protein
MLAVRTCAQLTTAFWVAWALQRPALVNGRAAKNPQAGKQAGRHNHGLVWEISIALFSGAEVLVDCSLAHGGTPNDLPIPVEKVGTKMIFGPGRNT